MLSLFRVTFDLKHWESKNMILEDEGFIGCSKQNYINPLEICVLEPKNTSFWMIYKKFVFHGFSEIADRIHSTYIMLLWTISLIPLLFLLLWFVDVKLPSMNMWGCMHRDTDIASDVDWRWHFRWPSGLIRL